MGVWMSPWGFLLALLLSPLALFGAFGVVVLAIKVWAVVQKAFEPATVDEHGQYGLDQSKEVDGK